MRIVSRAFLVAFLVVCVTVAGRAAGVLLQGTVVDPAGGPVPGAAVELLSGTRVAAKVVSAGDGSFKFPDLAPGHYEVRVTLAGFRQTRMAVTVGSTAPAPVRIRLLIGSASETVTITSTAPPAQGSAKGEAASRAPAAPIPVAPSAEARAMPYGGMGRGGGAGADTSLRALQPESETYAAIDENKFRRPAEHPLSTFSIDVDTASYTNVRRFLNEGRLPPADAVRVEELINYFRFDYADSTQGAPFGVTTELAPCPWDARHKLALVGLQARRLPAGRTPPRNLVFLIDVSGSMAPDDKLPLVKNAMLMLGDTLTAEDRVGIVTYAGSSGVALSSTRGDRRGEIQSAIRALAAGGSTNGGAGIQLAYDMAAQNFVKGGINRVILATDGDFNVGVTSLDALTRLIEEKRGTGVFLSVLGVGTGNLKDATMERLADK